MFRLEVVVMALLLFSAVMTQGVMLYLFFKEAASGAKALDNMSNRLSNMSNILEFIADRHEANSRKSSEKILLKD